MFFLLAACGGQAQGASPDGGRVDGAASGEAGGGEVDAGGQMDAGVDVVCECSGSNVITGSGVQVVPGSVVDPCGQPSCEDECGHEWRSTCGSLGEWTCQGGFPPPPACLDAGQDGGTDAADAADPCGVPLCTWFDHTAACIGCLATNCSLCSYESVCCPVTDDSCANNTQIFDTCLATQCSAQCASDGG